MSLRRKKEVLTILKLGIKFFLLSLLIFSFVFAKTHVVKKGESLALIAKKYKVSVDELIKVNNLKKPYIIRPGQKLKIPEKKITAKSKSKTKNLQNCKIIHKVKRGETLIKIAKKYHVWVRDLRKINNLKNDNLRAGQLLCIKKGKPVKSNITRKEKTKKKEIFKTVVKKEILIHKVKKGESLTLIARKYKTSVNEIIKANKLKKPYIIRPGQKLKVPVKVVKKIKIDNSKKLEKIYANMPFGFIWPVDGEVISDFVGGAKDIALGLNQIGIKIKTNCNEPVRASESGKVLFAGKINKTYKKMVVIKHRKNFSTVYSNLEKIAVKDKQFVKKGDIIGYSGVVVEPDVCGIFFQIRKNITPVNPLALLPEKKKEVNK